MMKLVLSCLALFACGGADVSASSANNTNTTSAPMDDLCLVDHFKGDYVRAKSECTAACDAAPTHNTKDSCELLGRMYASGEGIPTDPDRGHALYVKACDLGSARACALVTPAAPATVAPASGGMQMSIGSIEADGMRITNLSCTNVQGGGFGLLGGIALAAGFKQRKAQLDACTMHSSEARVSWTGVDGHMTHVQSNGDASAKACVERALANAPSTISGTCEATVHLH